MSTFFASKLISQSPLEVPLGNKPERLDVVLVGLLPGYSRSFFKQLIDKHGVLINGKPAATAGTMVKPGGIITFAPELLAIPQSSSSGILPTQEVIIIHEEPDFAIINKPAGLMVHRPAHSDTSATLVDWIMHRYGAIGQIGSPERPGIVHRLDKDTSGLMIIARTHHAHAVFTALFQQRAIHKEYLALVVATPVIAKGSVSYPIGRDPYRRTRMVAVGPRYPYRSAIGVLRDALTDYEVISIHREYSLVRLSPHTGRTHQIRVHMQIVGNPLLGDTVYGVASPLINRHALHASRLQFVFDERHYEWEIPLPDDMASLII